MSETTVSADLLQALQIVTELRVDTVGQDLRALAVGDVALSVKEPGGDLVLSGVLEDGDNSLQLFGGEFTGTVGIPLVLNPCYSRSVAHCADAYRLFRSTSAFLQTKLEYRRPTPLIRVMAYITFSFPSTFVLRRRKICWCLG